MHTKELLDLAVSHHLRAVARQMNLFGSALPQNRNRLPEELVVTTIVEDGDQLVYFFNTKTFVDSGDFRHALAGNAPIIADRADGKLYSTGTAYPIDHYLKEFRAGIRHEIEVR